VNTDTADTSGERGKELHLALNPNDAIVRIELSGELMFNLTRGEATIGGGSFLRLDVPKGEDGGSEAVATQFYSPSAVYCITPTTEDIARKVAGISASPFPVTRFELAAARGDVELGHGDGCDDDEEPF